MNVPKLRFKEFNDEWISQKLCQLVEFSKGNILAKADLDETGNYPCILYGQLYTKYNEVIREVYSKTNRNENKIPKSRKGDVLIPSSGETPVDISTSSCILIDNVLLGGDINILRPISCDGRFLSYTINNNKKTEIAKVAQGHSVVHLYNDNLSQVSINIPSVQEQKRISDTLELLDKKIELQSKKIEDLKLFKLKSFDVMIGKINEYQKIKNIGKLKNGYAFKNNLYNDKGLYNILTISNVTGNLYINSNFKNKYSFIPKDIQNHQILKEKDILISMTGNVGRVSFNKGKNNLLNQRVGVLELNEAINRDYIFYMLSNKNFENKMIDCGQGAAQLNITKADIENYKIPYPNKQKQLKITKILNCLTKKIQLEENKLNKLQELKKGLMQNMFV